MEGITNRSWLRCGLVYHRSISVSALVCPTRCSDKLQTGVKPLSGRQTPHLAGTRAEPFLSFSQQEVPGKFQSLEDCYFHSLTKYEYVSLEHLSSHLNPFTEWELGEGLGNGRAGNYVASWKSDEGKDKDRAPDEEIGPEGAE